tara:strand:+ start:551 stop:1417 length:867 start_codon:yes stop_codon:yes gene_type:complete
MIYDSIIIGAGPAGITAAMQMKRSGLKIAIFEGERVGGLLRNANNVENYLGFPDGISGVDLIAHFREHLNTQKVPLIQEEVLEVGGEEGAFIIQTPRHTYKSKTVVIATGTSPLQANIEGEEELAGTKLFYEVADLPEDAKNANIILIGGGDAAFDYAINLFERGHKPTIVTRGEASCLPILRVRAEEKGILYREYASPTSVQQIEDQVEVQLDDGALQADYVFVAVGREPRYPRITVQSRKGIHFAGDVHGNRFRQVHIAAGDALRVAMDISLSLLASHDERRQRIR